MAPSAINDAPLPSGRNSPKPPPAKLYTVKEPPFEGFRPTDTEGWARSNNETAIVIDNGIGAYINICYQAYLT
jgi:actin-related protein 5